MAQQMKISVYLRAQPCWRAKRVYVGAEIKKVCGRISGRSKLVNVSTMLELLEISYGSRIVHTIYQVKEIIR